MNRRQFLQVSTTAAVGATVARARVADENQPLTASGRFLFASAPVLINPSPDGITVLCAINSPGTGWVEFGPDEKLGHRADGASGGFAPYSDRLLSFRLTGLKPGAKYFYRVHAAPINFTTAYSIKRGDTIVSPINSFRTLDPSAKESTFTIWNDTHENADTLRALTKSLHQNPTDVLIWNGDVTNDIKDESKIIDQFISPAGQPFAQSVPLFLSRGNHDVRGQFARKLPHYINGPASEYFYAFRIGPLACIILDSGEDKPDDKPVYAGLNRFAEYRSLQRQWLAKVIESPDIKEAKHKIALIHIPLVWDAPIPERWKSVWDGFEGWKCEDGRSKWEDLLIKAGVKVVISGHTHRHIVFPPNPTRPWAQLIGGGPTPDAATSITGRADEKRLELVMRNLKGEELWKQDF